MKWLRIFIMIAAAQWTNDRNNETFDWLVSVSSLDAQVAGVANRSHKNRENDSAHGGDQKNRVHEKMINELRCRRLRHSQHVVLFWAGFSYLPTIGRQKYPKIEGNTWKPPNFFYCASINVEFQFIPIFCSPFSLLFSICVDQNQCRLDEFDFVLLVFSVRVCGGWESQRQRQRLSRHISFRLFAVFTSG